MVSISASYVIFCLKNSLIIYQLIAIGLVTSKRALLIKTIERPIGLVGL